MLFRYREKELHLSLVETWLQENMNNLVELEVFNDSLWIEGAELKNSRFL